MKTRISTNKAPAAVGPYSQAVRAGNLVFISGQIPLDPMTGKLVNGDITLQTRQVMENLSVLIHEAEMTYDNVVKCSCFLKNMEDFTDFNQEYASYFKEPYPARECVEVARLPKDVLIEISMILSA